jgi:pilus assembly protein FimV
MLAIFEANPQAFQGNINILSAGASLRMPSADDIYRIDRSDALSEVQRQHSAWGGYVAPPTVSQPVIATDTRPSLTLVPPDEEPMGIGTGADEMGDGDEPMTREQEVLDRIAELEAADVPIQQSLIEIRDNELAALRAELADIRGEVYEPPLDDSEIFDDEFADDALADDEFADDEILADDTIEEPVDDEIGADSEDVSTPVSQGPSSILIDDSPSLVDQVLGWLTSIWAIIGAVVIAVAGLLIWFVRRDRDDDDESGAWDALDVDEMRIDPLDSTESIQAPQIDDSIVVVEQDSAITPLDDDTVEAPMAAVGEDDASDGTGQFGSLEDTFSSETAVNLDQSDPVAEADFHMAYGLYDQAADLINGALQIEPDRQDLLTKLCEIYFVWGNRDAFTDAAQRLKGAVGDGESADWDKIVIMGQQIAADHELFAGAGVAGATKAVDLSFEDEAEGTGALDMEFGDEDGGDDIIDLGAGDDETQAADDGVDFVLDDDLTELADSSETAEATGDFSITSEMPTIEASTSDPTVETPTIEEQFAGFDSSSELPSIDEDSLESAIEESGQTSDETAEIDIDDLDLDIDGLAETELATLDDIDVTGTNEALDELLDVTGKNPQVDPDATGVQTVLGTDATGVQNVLDPDATGMSEVIHMEDELASTGEMRLATDETGQNPMVDAVDPDSTDLGNLLDATGHTQVLSPDMAVDTASEEAGLLSDVDATLLAPDNGDDETLEGPIEDDETVLASLDDDDPGDFDFAKTEALPPDVFTGSTNLDETGELPAVASTDVDLDLDDLTAALKVSELGDTIEQPRDDATVEQPRDDATVEQPRPTMDDDDGTVATLTLAAGEMSDDLQEARTMTEVGTKLDLARAYVDMGDPAGARGILEEVLDEGDDSQRQQAQGLLDSLPS